jgi:Family of unknown function (DUF6527)
MPNPIVIARECKNEDGRVGTRHYYWCPGCDNLHGIAIRPHTQDNGAGWEFSGTLECPTYVPSQYTTWDRGEETQKFVCHTFIRGGQIEFLGDCTHALKGQKVPLPPLPDWLVNETLAD